MFDDFVVLFVIEWEEEQRVCIKFYVKSGKTYAENIHMSQTDFEDERLIRSICYDWSEKNLKKHIPCSGRPTVSTDDDHHVLSTTNYFLEVRGELILFVTLKI